MIGSLAEFCRFQLSALRSIASATHGEMTIDDVKQQAWLVAEEIERKRGHSIDFEDRADQGLILAWLRNKVVKFAEKQVRHALRLDRGWDAEDEEQSFSWAQRLAAPDHSDPLVQLQRAESEVDYERALKESYAEVAAYLILLLRVDWDANALAADLRITVNCLRERLRRCLFRAQVQPNLFDRVSVIDPAFEPRRNRPRLPPRSRCAPPSRQIVFAD